MAAYIGVLRTWSNIYNEAFLRKYLTALSRYLFWQKKIHGRWSTGLKIGFWLRVRKLTLVLSLQIKPRNYSAGKYVWHRFRKGESPCWESKQNEWLCRSSRPKCTSKKVLWETSRNSQLRFCTGVSLMINLNSIDLELH